VHQVGHWLRLWLRKVHWLGDNTPYTGFWRRTTFRGVSGWR